MLAEIAAEELSDALDRVVEGLLVEVDCREPPVDAFQTARRLDMIVAEDAGQTSRARCVRLAAGPGRLSRATILLRPDPRPERLHWALAHEIGEFMTWRVFQRLGVDPEVAAANARESVANQLAGRLLLPGCWFSDDARRLDWDLLQLKSRYATASHELIARRMLDLPEPAVVTLFDHGRISFRRGNVPGRPPRLSEAERACWQTVHARDEPHRIEQGAISIQGWPVHEPDWKREILRTALPPEIIEVDW
jgi:Zn-dependent peptidase ImmA (M78 family)